jgi:hypothetical protein
MRRYKDIYGDTWVKLNNLYVRRVTDGNIGLWDNGRGLS